jgi:formylmethanofuran dehydrogenase subunit E
MGDGVMEKQQNPETPDKCSACHKFSCPTDMVLEDGFLICTKCTLKKILSDGRVLSLGISVPK